MDPAVAFGRREAEQVLRVQFVGDAGKRGAEILPLANFRVAAARLLCDASEARVGHVGHQHRL